MLQDLVHADIKPGNIMTEEDSGITHVIDTATMIDHQAAPLEWLDKGYTKMFLPPELMAAMRQGASLARTSALKDHKVRPSAITTAQCSNTCDPDSEASKRSSTCIPCVRTVLHPHSDSAPSARAHRLAMARRDSSV
jgi:hypothetical protein